MHSSERVGALGNVAFRKLALCDVTKYHSQMNDSTLVHRGLIILDLIINHTRLLHLVRACVLINTKLLYNFIPPLSVEAMYQLLHTELFEPMWSMYPNVSIYVLIEFHLLKSGLDAFQSRCARFGFPLLSPVIARGRPLLVACSHDQLERWHNPVWGEHCAQQARS